MSRGFVILVISALTSIFFTLTSWWLMLLAVAVLAIVVISATRATTATKIVSIVVAVGVVCWLLRFWTFTIPVVQFVTPEWQEISCLYGEKLTVHDLSVINACANEVGVDPSAVVRSIYSVDRSVPGMDKKQLDEVREWFHMHSGTAWRLTNVNPKAFEAWETHYFLARAGIDWHAPTSP